MGDDLKGLLKDWAAVKDFVFAGNAVFTLRSTKTGARYTYKVRAKKEDLERGEADGTYFVNLLRGPDNTADFAYVGVLRRDMALRLTSASRMGRGAPAVAALVWFLDAMRNGRAVLPVPLEVWHEGRCGRCGRLLTVPESIGRGIGPECAGRMAA